MNYLSQLLVFRNTAVAAVLAIVMAMTGIATPVNADTAGQQSTRNLIIGGLAAVAAVVLYNNYEHKYRAAHTVVGYTRDGGTVYADGRVVYPDGTTLYTGNRAGYRCSYDGYGTPCGQTAYAYGRPGHHYGWNKHHRGRGEQGDQDNQGDDGGGD